MILQPELANTHISLRPLLAADREALYAVAADPLIWEQHPYHNRWQRPVFDRFFDDAIASGGGLLASDPATGTIIGSSRFDTSRAGENEIEIGWTFLARSHWGTKANPAMKALMLAHALKSFPCVIFIIGAANHRSRRAVEKIGAVLTPRTDILPAPGQPVSHVTYAIDRAAFASGPIAHLA
jgi:RimJ/RimL family protein N-acetyltransferase